MKLLTIVAGAVLVTAPAFAHEFWMEPGAFLVPKNKIVSVALRVGDGFPGEPFGRTPAHIKTFEHWFRGRRQPVRGATGASPAGRVTLTERGTHTLLYRSNASLIELPAAKFDAYLLEEGLDHVVAQRRARGDNGPGRERYSRCAKALVQCGDGPLVDARVGLPLELVVETWGANARVRLFRDGAPLAGALVRAERRGAAKPLRLRTDKDGRVTWPLTSGSWLVSAVWMVPARKHDTADWESTWTSTRFEVAPKRAVKRP